MLNESEYVGESPKSLERAEKCQPDYEGMIIRAKDKLGRSTAFRDAALMYLEGRTARNKMAELIGEIVTECNSLQIELDSLIQDQEKNNA